MKKLLSAVLFLFVIGSYGVTISHVHAATLSPDQAGSIQQTLDVMKARLVQLEMQQGLVPQGDSGLAIANPAAPQTVVPVAGGTGSSLSQEQIASISAALQSLTTALASLQATLVANPQLAVTNHAQVLAVLQGIGNTLASIGATLESGSSAPVAVAQPTPARTPVAVNKPAPSTQTPAPTPAPVASTGNQPGSPAVTGGTTPNSATPAAAQNTAQASSFVTFTKDHWPTIAIVVLIIIALIVLFWPGGEEDATANRGTSKPMNQTSRPMSRENSVSTNEQRGTMTSSSNSPSPATPVSTVVAAPAQKVDVQPAKVTVVRPQDPKRKTA